MDKNILVQLFIEQTQQQPDQIIDLPRSGSDRIYIRLVNNDTSILGVFNPNVIENEAYFSFTDTFYKNGVNVPKIIAISANKQYYLVEDLGDKLLYNKVLECNGQLSDEVISYYKKALQYLVKMQLKLDPPIDYSKSYPIDTFNSEAIQWDLNYFKYNYLKIAGIDFNEYDLEDDFKTLKEYLLSFKKDYFMFRDFQSRNIIINNNDVHFIDFQGGRKGPLTYDVASLLYQAKAQLSDELRLELFNYYANELSNKTQIDYELLKNSFSAFALLRTLQVLGAYGYRGYFEKKSHFIQSIPFAIKNLKGLLFNNDFPVDLPYLKQLVENIEAPKSINYLPKDKLTVSITSFSYRKGIPADPSENGGGFVFDCRSIHNPGRYEEYKQLTGMDKPVIDFFEKENEMDEFLSNVFSLVDKSVQVYSDRGFKHLMVNFGCTGGQHRSVYSAERLTRRLIAKFDVYVTLWHREQDKMINA